MRIVFNQNYAVGILGASALAAVLLIAAASIVTPQKAYAVTFVTWDGGGDTFSFSDPLNWDTDTVPAPGEAIIINAPYHVVLDIDFTLEGDAQLTINDGARLSVDVGKTLTVANAVTGSTGLTNNLGGTIDNVGTIIVANSDDGAVGHQNWGISNFGTINNYATINMQNTLSVGILNDPVGSIVNFGTINVANNDGTGIANNGAFANYHPGTLNIQNTGGFGLGVGGSFTNTGTVNVANIGGTGIENPSRNFSNSGTITVASGGTIFNTPGSLLTNSGTITVASGGTINNDGEIENDGTFTNSGTLNVRNNGQVVNDATINNQSGGVISTSSSGQILNHPGSIDPVINNNAGGIINNAGDEIVNQGTVNNAGTIHNDRRFLNDEGAIINNNAGGVINNNAKIDNFNDNARLNNNLGAIINNNAGGLINNIFGGITTNAGTIVVKNGGTSSNGILNDISSTITNSGTITLENSGYISIGIWNKGTLTNDNSGAITSANTANSSTGIWNDGTMTNSGVLTVANTGTPSSGIVNKASFANSGTLNIQNTSNNYNTGVSIIGSGILTNSGTVDVQNIGSGTYGIWRDTGATLHNLSGGTINNLGTILIIGCIPMINEGTYTGNPVIETCDSDNDGIANNIDIQPNIFSNDFSDIGIGGTSSGTIISRESQVLIIQKAPNPGGIRILGGEDGSGVPATVSACGGAATYSIAVNDEVIITCGSVKTQVFQGPVETKFFAVDASTLVASATIEAGSTITYDPVTQSITAGPDNISTTNVILANGNTVTVAAGQTVQIWTLKGFYSPVDMNSVVNTIKGGQSVPLKFEVFAGTVEKTAVSDIVSFTQKKISCSEFTGDPTDAVEELNTLGTGLKYDTTTGQFIANWKTPKSPNTCWEVTVTTADQSSIVAFFRLI